MTCSSAVPFLCFQAFLCSWEGALAGPAAGEFAFPWRKGQVGIWTKLSKCYKRIRGATASVSPSAAMVSEMDFAAELLPPVHGEVSSICPSILLTPSPVKILSVMGWKPPARLGGPRRGVLRGRWLCPPSWDSDSFEVVPGEAGKSNLDFFTFEILP